MTHRLRKPTRRATGLTAGFIFLVASMVIAIQAFGIGAPFQKKATVSYVSANIPSEQKEKPKKAKPPPELKDAAPATATTTAVPAAPAPEPAPAVQPASPPKLQLAVEDDGAFFLHPDMPQLRPAAMALTSQLQATWARVNIYQDKWQPNNAFYDDGISYLLANHIKPQLTIVCKDTVWTPESFDAYVRRVVTHFIALYGTQLSRWSICNEPNLNGWLEESHGMDKAATYRMLYIVGARAIYELYQAIGVPAEVLIGELSSSNNPKTSIDPMVFMRQVLKLDDSTVGQETLIANGFAYHPYVCFSASSQNCADDVGVDKLASINALLQEAFEKKAVTSPQDTEPYIFLTEDGWQVRTRGDRTGWPEEHRVAAALHTLEVVCTMPNVVEYLLYQLISSSAIPGWPSKWDTGLADAAGTPDPTHTALVAYIAAHPECIRNTP